MTLADRLMALRFLIVVAPDHASFGYPAPVLARRSLQALGRGVLKIAEGLRPYRSLAGARQRLQGLCRLTDQGTARFL
ncbi:hypothetical protein EMIT0P201_10906 [Pseudomonas chlororaphis]